PLAAIVPNTPIRLRGRRLYLQEEGVRRARRALPRGDRGIMLGPAPIPTRAAHKNIMVGGSVRSGKSITLRLILQQRLHDILRGKGRALSYDHKDEQIPQIAGMGLKVDQHVKTLLPYDARCWSWDLARDLRDRASIEHLASILFPNAKGATESGSFFKNA